MRKNVLASLKKALREEKDKIIASPESLKLEKNDPVRIVIGFFYVLLEDLLKECQKDIKNNKDAKILLNDVPALVDNFEKSLVLFKGSRRQIISATRKLELFITEMKSLEISEGRLLENINDMSELKTIVKKNSKELTEIVKDSGTGLQKEIKKESLKFRKEIEVLNEELKAEIIYLSSMLDENLNKTKSLKQQFLKITAFKQFVVFSIFLFVLFFAFLGGLLFSEMWQNRVDLGEISNGQFASIMSKKGFSFYAEDGKIKLKNKKYRFNSLINKNGDEVILYLENKKK